MALSDFETPYQQPTSTLVEQRVASLGELSDDGFLRAPEIGLAMVRPFDPSVILVTHDIGVVRPLAHRLMGMYRGQVMEADLTDQVLDAPHQPYTQQLVNVTLMP